MIRTTLTALAGVMALAAPGAAQAQWVVHDPTSFAQMLNDARNAVQQLESLREQVAQGERLFESLNDPSGVNALARELGLPAVRNPLPEIADLGAAIDGDFSRLGRLGDRAEAIREQNRIYTAPEGELSPAETYYRDTLERSGARAARDYAAGEAISQGADLRSEGLETLRRSLDTAPNARAVLDLSARIEAEQALIANDQTRLQGLTMMQAAEARLEEQRARERTEAARAERLALYRRNFQ